MISEKIFLRFFIIIFSVIALTACQTLDTKNTSTNSDAAIKAKDVFYHDSTHYFADRTASVSMRATFLNTEDGDKQELVEGYKLQFRTINLKGGAIGQVTIIAGGKQITLSENGFIIPPKQGINLELSLEETQFIHQQNDGLLRFKFQNESQLIQIKDHTLQPLNVDTLPIQG